MIESKHILTVGADWRNPKGGVAQVMANYANYIFGRDNFKCVVNSCGGNGIKKAWKAVYAMILMTWKMLVDNDIKIVHIHTASYNSFRRSSIFVKLAKWFDKKVILHIHGGGFKEYYQTNPKWILKELQQADALAVLSESWKKFFSSINANDNIQVINNVIPEPRKFDMSIGFNMPIKLLFLGAVCDAKGIFDLLDVLNENKIRFNGKIELHIGGNDEIERLQQYIADNSLENMVKFHGWVDGETKASLLENCHYYILPSYTEGLPLSIIEALSYGKPVLSTPVGGIPEIINESIGILFKPGNRQEIKQLLEQVVSIKNYDSLSNNALHSSRKFQPEEVKKQLNQIYLTV